MVLFITLILRNRNSLFIMMLDSSCEMNAIHMSDERTECDNVTALELQRTRRILHFSDGTMEEMSDSDGEDIGPDITDKSMELNIDVVSGKCNYFHIVTLITFLYKKTLPFASRIKYQAYYTSIKVLNAIDYVGEGLASFLGITSPKYVSESDIDAVFQEQECREEENATWKQGNNNTIDAVITSSPRSIVSSYP